MWKTIQICWSFTTCSFVGQQYLVIISRQHSISNFCCFFLATNHWPSSWIQHNSIASCYDDNIMVIVCVILNQHDKEYMPFEEGYSGEVGPSNSQHSGSDDGNIHKLAVWWPHSPSTSLSHGTKCKQSSLLLEEAKEIKQPTKNCASLMCQQLSMTKTQAMTIRKAAPFCWLLFALNFYVSFACKVLYFLR